MEESYGSLINRAWKALDQFHISTWSRAWYSRSSSNSFPKPVS
ncbi:hypothetical protein OIU74_013184 [Salix koriyanagi]|uniref:Uncharacterized protein n=1 Tax=Salix koriyanagi TaxID=2511006 RepID=A0A9Q0Q8J0_9ROSI|nr:hypothetical protein OIU74_013184 [Salix koriyanagi]